ncbi:hypothetical protein [Actinospica robiniae]|uniref:hypothetical protein n=1 Tax=Actinospica robiniae TaxID=304901 RepID=UPI0004138BD9|nr:hypothetical protein [Actinospica robiniae]
MAEESHVREIVQECAEKSEDLEMMWWRATFDTASLVLEGADEPLATDESAITAS